MLKALANAARGHAEGGATGDQGGEWASSVAVGAASTIGSGSKGGKGIKGGKRGKDGRSGDLEYEAEDVKLAEAVTAAMQGDLSAAAISTSAFSRSDATAAAEQVLKLSIDAVPRIKKEFRSPTHNQMDAHLDLALKAGNTKAKARSEEEEEEVDDTRGGELPQRPSSAPPTRGRNAFDAASSLSPAPSTLHARLYSTNGDYSTVRVPIGKGKKKGRGQSQGKGGPGKGKGPARASLWRSELSTYTSTSSTGGDGFEAWKNSHRS